MFEADIGVDDLGIGVYRAGAAIRFAYPITIVGGRSSVCKCGHAS
jgi:hypothetical protein